jgi:uncharacterized protein YodC (DUF2158 family)
MENKIWLRQGMLVRHVSNKNVVMTVERLCYKYTTILCEEHEEGAYYNTEYSDFTKCKKILTGVICRWINDNGNMENAEFHSRELIPIVDNEEILKNGNDYKNKSKENRND